MRLALLCLLASYAVLPPLSRAQAPVFVITPEDSTIKFFVKASVDLEGTFDKWDATLTFTSPDVTTGVLDIKIQAASVNTGSGMKDGKLKSKDFFDVTQRSVDHVSLQRRLSRLVPTPLDVPGNFTIRGVTKPETLTFTVRHRREPAPARLKEPWPSTARTTG